MHTRLKKVECYVIFEAPRLVCKHELLCPIMQTKDLFILHTSAYCSLELILQNSVHFAHLQIYKNRLLMYSKDSLSVLQQTHYKITLLIGVDGARKHAYINPRKIFPSL